MKSKTNKTLFIPLSCCICCGGTIALRGMTFTHIEKDALSYLWMLPLPGVDLMGLIFENYIRPKRTVVSNFCGDCSSRFSSLGTAHQLGGLAFLIVVFVSIVIAAMVHAQHGLPTSLIVLACCLAWAVLIKIATRFYTWKYSPKIHKIKLPFVELNAKGQKEIVEVEG